MPERIDSASGFIAVAPSEVYAALANPVKGGNLVSIRAEGVPPGIRREDHEAGMNTSLENLTAYPER